MTKIARALIGAAALAAIAAPVFAQAPAAPPAMQPTIVAKHDLGLDFEAMKGREMQMLTVVLNPRSATAPHSHAGRPEIVYVLKGVVTEVQGDVAKDYKPGEVYVSNANRSVLHHLENRTDIPAEFVSVLIATPTPPAAPPAR